MAIGLVLLFSSPFFFFAFVGVSRAALRASPNYESEILHLGRGHSFGRESGVLYTSV